MRFLVILLLLIPFEALSQSSPQQSPKDTAKKNPALLAIRQDALSVANQVIDEISEVEDLGSRVGLAEKVVQLLAKTRPERCRKMLDSIFDDVVVLKDSSKDRPTPPDVESILSRIIQAAAVVDLQLAQVYIETLSKIKELDGVGKSVSNPAALYLKIAIDLIRSNPSLAVAVATRSLANGITGDTLVFLVSLRQVNTLIANRFLITAVESCRNRGGRNVNELLLLYSYVFSPLRVPIVLPQGIATLQIPGYSEVARSYSVDAELAKQYLTMLTEILLDPDRYAGGNIQTLTLGVEGDFYVLSIFEPLAAIYLSSRASAFSAQRNLVTKYLEAGRREAAFSSAHEWTTSHKDLSLASGGNETTLEYLIEKAESAPDTKRKDQLYFRAAMTAVRLKKHEIALGLVDKISQDSADKAKQFIRFDIAIQNVRNHQLLEADKLARIDGVIARRAYIFTLIADYLTAEQHKDTSRALQYLEEVQHLAGKLSDEREQLAVLIGAASVYARLDSVRSSEIFQQAIKVANKVKDFVGDSSISNVLEIGGFYFDYSLYSDGLTIFDLIKRLTSGSYYSTLQDIRLLKNRTLRLRATVELCSAVISLEAQRLPAL